MLSRNSKFAAAHVVSIAVALVIVFRMANRYAGIGALGEWSLASALAGLCGIADLGVTDAMVRQVPVRRAKGDDDGVRRLVLACMVFVAFSVTSACILGAPLIYRALHSLIGPFAPGLVGLALGAALLNVLAAGLLGTLEGLEKYGWRLAAGLLSSSATIGAALVLLPSLRVSGLPVVFVIQAAVLFISSAWFVIWALRGHWRVTHGLGRDLAQLIGLGLPLRVAGVVNLAFEPITRVLLGKLVGVEALGLYEIAARLTGQLRGVMVGAAQVIVPRLVMLAGVPTAAATVLREAANLLGLISVIAFTLLALSLPVISFVLLGHIDRYLLAFGMLLSAAWLVNVWSTPTYFSNIVAARTGRNMLSHLSIGVLNILLGGTLGVVGGAVGVVTGTALALAAGSLLTILTSRPAVFPNQLMREDLVVCVTGAGAMIALLIGLCVTPDERARLAASTLLAGAYAIVGSVYGVPRVSAGIARAGYGASNI